MDAIRLYFANWVGGLKQFPVQTLTVFGMEKRQILLFLDSKHFIDLVRAFPTHAAILVPRNPKWARNASISVPQNQSQD
jgi:hypothetical protein